MLVNGPAMKVLIEEEFGDGIMSAIDFDMTIDRQADPKGDRVKLGMTGKFLPFKYYGATGNAQAYGFKEENGRSSGGSSGLCLSQYPLDRREDILNRWVLFSVDELVHFGLKIIHPRFNPILVFLIKLFVIPDPYSNGFSS